MPELFYESGSCAQRNCAILGVHPSHFSPSSVQFEGEINGAFPCKRQKRHLDFCTSYLLVGSSPTGRATSFLFNNLREYAIPTDRLLARQVLYWPSYEPTRNDPDALKHLKVTTPTSSASFFGPFGPTMA
jgi:hypothetical protein